MTDLAVNRFQTIGRMWFKKTVDSEVCGLPRVTGTLILERDVAADLENVILEMQLKSS